MGINLLLLPIHSLKFQELLTEIIIKKLHKQAWPYYDSLDTLKESNFQMVGAQKWSQQFFLGTYFGMLDVGILQKIKHIKGQ